jgi:hypothetical protein
MNLTCKKRGDEWWIHGLPDMDPFGVGPYGTKADAEADARGLERFYKNADKPGFVTTDPRKREI